MVNNIHCLACNAVMKYGQLGDHIIKLEHKLKMLESNYDDGDDVFVDTDENVPEQISIPRRQILYFPERKNDTICHQPKEWLKLSYREKIEACNSFIYATYVLIRSIAYTKRLYVSENFGSILPPTGDNEKIKSANISFINRDGNYKLKYLSLPHIPQILKVSLYKNDKKYVGGNYGFKDNYYLFLSQLELAHLVEKLDDDLLRYKRIKKININPEPFYDPTGKEEDKIVIPKRFNNFSMFSDMDDYECKPSIFNLANWWKSINCETKID
jgi:hypothetical protein